MIDYAQRPAADEYAAPYADYVAGVPDGSIVATLEAQRSEMAALAASVPPEREEFRYATRKWSIRELLGHVTDAERVFAYRLFCVARGEQQSLPGFEENEYAAIAGYDVRPLATIAAELDAARAGTLLLLRSFDDAALNRRGTANALSITARAIAWIMAGHTAHHLRILRERYDCGD